MKKILLGIAMSLAMVSPALANTHPSFGDIPWAVHDVTIKKDMANLGFSFRRKDADGSLVFQGNLFDEPTQVIEMLNSDGKLVKSYVNIMTPDADAFDTYRNVKEALIAKYGNPDLNIENWHSPYTSDDESTYGVFAVKNGYLTLACGWNNEAGNGDAGGIVLELGNNATVNISYESPAWVSTSNSLSKSNAL